jgi:hypothetical protein
MYLFRVLYLVLLVTVFLASCTSSEVTDPQDTSQKLRFMVSELESKGSALANGLDSVAYFYEFILSKRDSILSNQSVNPYQIDGAFSTHLPGENSSLSSVIILKSTPDRRRAETEVILTNAMDSVFVSYIDNHPGAAQIYSNSANQVSRVYPAYNPKGIVNANIDVTKFNFYYKADSVHNPKKELVWIPDPYVDPAGKGWILSMVHPVYDGSELFAVLGVDFTVSDFIQKYLDSEEGELILVNSKGDIVGGKADAIESLSMPPLRNHVYRETLESDYFRIADFNLFNSKSREVRKMAQRFLLEKKNTFDFEEEANLKHATCVRFNLVDWFLIEVSTNY